MIPRGLEASWRELSLVERYYLRSLDIESRGERRKGMYEELARGFGVTDIRPLLKSDKANCRAIAGGTRVCLQPGEKRLMGIAVRGEMISRYFSPINSRNLCIERWNLGIVSPHCGGDLLNHERGSCQRLSGF